MAINNFKELQKEQEKDFQGSEGIRNQVVNSVGIFKFIGEILELFLPKVLSLFVGMSGGGYPRQNVNHDLSSDDNIEDFKRPRYPNTYH